MDDNNDFIPEAIKPGMVDPMDSEKLSYIINQENKCCCKINSNGNGTGFFCKIILNESLKILPVLMTCNHVLTENDIKIGKSIDYSLYNGKKKFNIIIDNSRLVYTNSEMDFTIIQLWKNEYISLLNSVSSLDKYREKEQETYSFYLTNGINAIQSSFDDSDLYNSRFIRAELNNTSFRNCNIKKTCFYEIKQENVSFKLSNTREALFSVDEVVEE